MLKYIRKRDGYMDAFMCEKITEAIYKAFQATCSTYDYDEAQKLAHIVEKKLIEKDAEVPTVELVQDLVEETLIEKGYAKVAKAYILYRDKHNQMRHSHSDDFQKMNITQMLENGFTIGESSFRAPHTITSFTALTSIIIQNQSEPTYISQFDTCMAKGIQMSYCKWYYKNLKNAIHLLTDISYETIWQKIQEIHFMPSLHHQDDQELKMLLSEYQLSDEMISRIHSFVLKEAYQDTNRETYQAMEGFIHQLNTLYQKENKMCLIDYGLDVSIEGKMVTSNLLQVSRAGVGDGSSFDSPQQICYIQAGVNKNKEDCHYDLYQLAYEVHQQRGIPLLKEI